MQKFYKGAEGEIFAYTSEEEKKRYGSSFLVPLTDFEILSYQQDRKSLRAEELQELVWRDAQLSFADHELNKVQDSDPKAIGTVGEWRTYRKELRNWPEDSNFPDKQKRPVSPDMKE